MRTEDPPKGSLDSQADGAAEALLCLLHAGGDAPSLAPDTNAASVSGGAANASEDDLQPRGRRRTSGTNPRFVDFVPFSSTLLARQQLVPPVQASSTKQHRPDNNNAAHPHQAQPPPPPQRRRRVSAATRWSGSEEDDGESSGGGGGGARVRQLAAGSGVGGSNSTADKEWGALTTWIRQNLKEPRTPKKLVLFVGHQDPVTGAWGFDLNPGLTWGDVSVETKARLKTLAEETAATFARKYVGRDPGGWRQRPQRYRPPSGGPVVEIPLGELVDSLQSIFFRHQVAQGTALTDPSGCQPWEHQLRQEQQQQQQQQPVWKPAEPAAAEQPAGSSGGSNTDHRNADLHADAPPSNHAGLQPLKRQRVSMVDPSLAPIAADSVANIATAAAPQVADTVAIGWPALPYMHPSSNMLMVPPPLPPNTLLPPPPQQQQQQQRAAAPRRPLPQPQGKPGLALMATGLPLLSLALPL